MSCKAGMTISTLWSLLSKHFMVYVEKKSEKRWHEQVVHRRRVKNSERKKGNASIKPNLPVYSSRANYFSWTTLQLRRSSKMSWRTYQSNSTNFSSIIFSSNTASKNLLVALQVVESACMTSDITISSPMKASRQLIRTNASSWIKLDFWERGSFEGAVANTWNIHLDNERSICIPRNWILLSGTFHA